MSQKKLPTRHPIRCNIFLLTLTAFCLPLLAQNAPQSDIWLGDLSLNSKPSLTRLVNITDRAGYDNQPHFLTNGDMLYTSGHNGANGSQTEVMYFTLNQQSSKNLTRSPVSEYSPTLMPDSSHYSVIQVNRDNQQHLWAYPLTGSSPARILLPAVEPVGYHAWINPGEVLLFVLGEPHRLERVNINTHKRRVLDENIGPSLFKIPGTDKMSYTKSRTDNGQTNWTLMALSVTDNAMQPLVELPDGAYYYTWAADQTALSATGTKLYRWQYGSSARQWQLLADITEHCPLGATRLAVNHTLDKLAVVCNRTDSNQQSE